MAYRSTFSEGNRIKHSSAWECHYSSNYYSKTSKFDKYFENLSGLDKYLENLSGQPGIIYDFNIQNLVIHKDNIKYKGDIPLVAYIDFETTAPTDSCLNPGDKKNACSILSGNFCILSWIKTW